MNQDSNLSENIELINKNEGNAIDAQNEDDELPKPRVVRRDKVGRTSVHTDKRFSNIISCYIPMTTNFSPATGDRRGLLNSATEEEEEENAEQMQGGNASTDTILSVNSINERQFRGAVFNAEKLFDLYDLPDSELESGADICNLAILRDDILLSFTNSYTFARISIDNEEATTAAAIRLHPFSVTIKGESLLPTDIRVHQGRLFVSGSIQRSGSAALSSVLVECSPDGTVVRATKELPYPKFAGFDVDSEGNLLVASPMQTSVQGDVQVFKMSSDFRRKLFKIELGGRRTRYKPQFVACIAATNTCWVSAQRSEGEGTLARVGAGANKTRLLTFPISKPGAGGGDQIDNPAAPVHTREWLKVASWKFQSVDPGRVVAFGKHLLVLDATNGNLLCVSVTQNSNVVDEVGKTESQYHMCQPITAPSKEGGPHFTALCVDHREPDTVLAATTDTIYKLTLRI